MELKPVHCCKFATDRMIKVFWSSQSRGLVYKFRRAYGHIPAVVSRPRGKAADTCFQESQTLVRKGHVHCRGKHNKISIN